MNSKYDYQRIGFIKKHGEQPVLKIADAIAEYLWFSFRKTYAEIKRMPAAARKDAMKLLRAAQEARMKPNADYEWLWRRGQMDLSLNAFFDLSESRPAAYFKPIQRLEVAGELAGATVRSERVSGGKIRVHYSSKLTGLKLNKIEIRDIASEFVKSQGLHIWQAVFICEKAIA